MKPWNIAASLLAAPLLAGLALLAPETDTGLGVQDTKKTRKPPKGAQHLTKMDNWVRKVKIRTMESAPPQFAVILTVAMPTPGWKLKVDKVSAADAQKRIQIYLTGKRPEGMLPQVITNTDVRVYLGRLPKGRYLLDVFGRYDAAQPHVRRGVTLVHAFDKWGR